MSQAARNFLAFADAYRRHLLQPSTPEARARFKVFLASGKPLVKALAIEAEQAGIDSSPLWSLLGSYDSLSGIELERGLDAAWTASQRLMARQQPDAITTEATQTKTVAKAKAATTKPKAKAATKAKTIPKGKRSKPMSKLEAMNFYGWPASVHNERAAREWLNRGIELGDFRIEATSSRKLWIFHIDDFPEKVRDEIRQV
jgi:hypothetical protein